MTRNEDILESTTTCSGSRWSISSSQAMICRTKSSLFSLEAMGPCSSYTGRKNDCVHSFFELLFEFTFIFLSPSYLPFYFLYFL